MPPLLLKLVFERIKSGPMPFFVRPVATGIAAKVNHVLIDPQLANHLDYMEGELGKTTWFAGEELTGADIQMSFPLEAAVSRAGLNASRPNLMRFLERIHARPAYARALARGGPYDLVKLTE
jgi:glutathione S-transferase